MISSGIFEYSHKFLRGTNFRAAIPVCDTDASNDGFGFGIIKMAKVPGQEIIDAMYSGYGNVKRVIQGLDRDGASLEKRFGQYHYILCD
jgi:hypothetical protein